MGLPDIGLLAAVCRILTIDSNELLQIETNFHISEDNSTKTAQEIKENMVAEPLKMQFGAAFIPMIEEGMKSNLINETRKYLVTRMGILMPVVRIMDNIGLDEKEYQIISYDKVLYQEKLNTVEDTSYEAIILKLSEICEQNYSFILNKQLTKTILDTTKELYSGILEDIVPEKISYLFVCKVLAALVKQSGNIRSIIKIMEIVEEEVLFQNNKDIDSIVNQIVTEL